MEKYRVEIVKKAKKDLLIHYKSGNKATIKKIEILFTELSLHPTTGTGKPEQLKFELEGFWSRRINAKDRMIYQINNNTVLVTVISAIGHYGDK